MILDPINFPYNEWPHTLIFHPEHVLPFNRFRIGYRYFSDKWFFLHTGTQEEHKWWFDNNLMKRSRYKWIKKEKIIHKKKETFTQITTRNRVLQLIAIPLQYWVHYDSNMVAMQIIIIDQIFCFTFKSLNVSLISFTLYENEL